MGGLASKEEKTLVCVRDVLKTYDVPKSLVIVTDRYASDPKDWHRGYNIELEVNFAGVVVPDDYPSMTKIDIARRAMECAWKQRVKISAHGAGQSPINAGLGGGSRDMWGYEPLVISMMNFRDFEFEDGVATIGSGLTLGEVDEKLYWPHRRAIPLGSSPYVSFGGNTVLGGVGPASRLWGLTSDQVLEMEVLLANGSVVIANDAVNQDLFWAMRGAGNSFGIVTKFKVKTYPAPEQVVQYTYSYTMGMGISFVDVLEEWLIMANDEHLDHRFSSQLVMKPGVAFITGTFYGPEAAYNASGIHAKVLKSPLLDEYKVSNWSSTQWHHHQEYLNILGFRKHASFYGRSQLLAKNEMPDRKSLERLLLLIGGAHQPWINWYVVWETVGGAINLVRGDATAFPHRDKLVNFQAIAMGTPKMVNDVFKIFQNRVNRESRILMDRLQNTTNHNGSIPLAILPGWQEHKMNHQTALRAYWGTNIQLLEELKAKWDDGSWLDGFHKVRNWCNYRHNGKLRSSRPGYCEAYKGLGTGAITPTIRKLLGMDPW
ncbi:hypothetical protein S40293_04462 [Stachybotrys chartarum IBT 40293]|nr:hypothetical protein S40293_04462 [Stachybotrys chartarum IBT 40293]KFA72545.1 hypothetical protein S40288_08902 [Stachybotrys chartarum IBT 40288]